MSHGKEKEAMHTHHSAGILQHFLFFTDDCVVFYINTVRGEIIEKVKGVNPHVDELGIIEGIKFFFTALIPENHDSIFHLLTADNVFHGFPLVQEGI